MTNLSAAREQPLPVAGQRNVHDELRHRYGACVGIARQCACSTAILAFHLVLEQVDGTVEHILVRIQQGAPSVACPQSRFRQAVLALCGKCFCPQIVKHACYVATLLHMAEAVREELVDWGVVE